MERNSLQGENSDLVAQITSMQEQITERDAVQGRLTQACAKLEEDLKSSHTSLADLRESLATTEMMLAKQQEQLELLLNEKQQVYASHSIRVADQIRR